MNQELSTSSASKNAAALQAPATYVIEKRKFVVTPAFQESGRETLSDILLRLIFAEVKAN